MNGTTAGRFGFEMGVFTVLVDVLDMGRRTGWMRLERKRLDRKIWGGDEDMRS